MILNDIHFKGERDWIEFQVLTLGIFFNLRHIRRNLEKWEIRKRPYGTRSVSGRRVGKKKVVNSLAGKSRWRT